MRLWVLPPPKPVFVWMMGFPPLPDRRRTASSQEAAHPGGYVGAPEKFEGVSVDRRAGAVLDLLEIGGEFALEKCSVGDLRRRSCHLYPRPQHFRPSPAP